jgi:pilus assembly protein CpaB
VILVALVLGLVTGYLVLRKFREMDEKSRKNWQPVVIAKVDIKARTKVSREMLELTAYPKELIAEGVITRLEDVENRMVGRELRAKEQVRGTDLVAEGTVPTLAYKVPDGMRAIAIGAGEVMAVGTSVQPGDRVDILGTYHDPRTRQELTKIILQNVLVLAVNRGQTEAGQEGGGANSSMTLAVRPEDTELVAAADRMSALRVALRRVNDARLVATDGVTTRDFSGQRSEDVTTNQPPARVTPVVIAPPPGEEPKRQLTIIRGTQEQNVGL